MSYGNSRTAGDVVEESIRQLLSGEREPLNKLSGSVGANATSITMRYDIDDIARSSLIEVDTEVFRVWSKDPATKEVTVEPAMLGSVSAAHDTDALARINPRIFRHAAMTALNDELRALSSPALGLFAVKTLEFQVESAISDYDLNTSGAPIVDVLAVRMNNASADQHWQDLPDWQLRRNSDSTVFADSQSLFLPTAYSNRTVQVVYSTEFTAATSLTDDIEATCGLPAQAQDILVLGVLLRLGSVREIKRNFTEYQGDTRRAAEVPATAVGNSFSYVRAMRQQRIDEEATRLMRKYPIRRR